MTWAIITTASFVPSVLIITFMCRKIASHTFKCSNCAHEFRISAVKILITEHSDDNYITECPECKNKCICIKQPLGK